MSDMPESEEGVRPYYEHPLTAATTAMLNLGSEDQASTIGFIYDYYNKIPTLVDKEKALGELWQTSTASGGGVPLIASQVKAANGIAGGLGLSDLPPPPSSVSPQDIGIFVHHNSHQGVTIKREPEDLSQSRKGDRNLNSVKIGGSGVSVVVGPTAKVSLTNGGLANGDVGVLDAATGHVLVKEERSSPHRGTPSSSTSSSSLGSTVLAVTGAPVEGELIVPTTETLKIGGGTMSSSVHAYTSQIFGNIAGTGVNTSSANQGSFSDHVTQYSVLPSTTQNSYASTTAGNLRSTGSAYTLATAAASDPYYREYFTVSGDQYQTVRQQLPYESTDGSSFVERYVRQSSIYKPGSAGLTVDLPSPDSGIGTDAITPRDQTAIQQSFDYAELCQAQPLGDPNALGVQRPGSNSGASGRSRPWHDFGRQNDADKVQIPKVYSQYGFKYYLETPISTSQRREDDRITYINKGQFYGITLEYIPDPDKPLKSSTVKSVVMLMFREEKSPEDEIKAWQFWHGRQHSVKQRILDADTKNSVGLVGCIEEVAHNAIAVYWNPLESSAKINVAVQCLSTDFSSQKGVKGLPLHLQIDTYEDPREGSVYHRGYCQIKVFCDKGAERKTRDEERRAAKRKMTATGRKKMDELYHPTCERSEFYGMSDLAKPPVLFTPAEDIDKLTSMELQGFYNHETDSSSLSNGEAGSTAQPSPLGKQSTSFLLHSNKQSGTTLKFHNHFPPDNTGDKKDVVDANNLATDSVFTSPAIKRPKLTPPLNERVMLYVRQESDDIYTPLHVVPPTTMGLMNAIENKYKISTSSITNLYRKNKKGIIAKIDDDMLKYYCNEDLFLLEIKQVDGEEAFEVTLVEAVDQ